MYLVILQGSPKKHTLIISIEAPKIRKGTNEQGREGWGAKDGINVCEFEFLDLISTILKTRQLLVIFYSALYYIFRIFEIFNVSFLKI